MFVQMIIPFQQAAESEVVSAEVSAETRPADFARSALYAYRVHDARVIQMPPAVFV